MSNSYTVCWKNTKERGRLDDVLFTQEEAVEAVAAFSELNPENEYWYEPRIK